MKRNSLIWILLLLVIMSISITNVQGQCAMCRASVESNLSSGDSTIGAGLNKGILFLLVMPYMAICIVAYLWYRTSTKDRNKRLYIANILKEKLNIS